MAIVFKKGTRVSFFLLFCSFLFVTGRLFLSQVFFWSRNCLPRFSQKHTSCIALICHQNQISENCRNALNFYPQFLEETRAAQRYFWLFRSFGRIDLIVLSLRGIRKVFDFLHIQFRWTTVCVCVVLKLPCFRLGVFMSFEFFNYYYLCIYVMFFYSEFCFQWNWRCRKP